MKKIAVILVFFCVTISFAQEQKSNIKLERQGDIVKATYFNSDGTISQQGSFKGNLRHGNWISFNNKGEELVVGYYNKGAKTGKWIFKENGNLKEVDYLDNMIINVNEWSNKSTILVSN